MSTKRLKILHVNKYHCIIGGAEAIYFRTAEIMEENGHESLYFALRHPRNVPCKTEEYFMPYIDIDKPMGVLDYVMVVARNFY